MDILSSFYTLATPSLSLLFVLSFLAATILPIGSEWLLIVMVVQGFTLPSVVITATLGNYLGACTTYLIGIWGSDFIIRTVCRIDDRQLERAENLYKQYGSWSLLLSWLPVVGDPLCLIGGVFRISIFRFSFLVFVGKFFRYAILALLAQYGTGG
jgi:membrane protein YqaA with SNARE-associated domain